MRRRGLVGCGIEIVAERRANGLFVPPLMRISSTMGTHAPFSAGLSSLSSVVSSVCSSCT